jgi:S-adenosylmethionine:tRNA ribosyltransferase-isomerase
MNPQQLLETVQNTSIANYQYALPSEKIALHPLKNRAESKLLIYQKGIITETQYANIASNIPANSLMIFNNTKVVNARLHFKKATGGQIEIFYLEPHEQYADITTAMLQCKEVTIQCLIGGANKWKPTEPITANIITSNLNFIVTALLVEKRTDCFIVSLKWNIDISFAEVLLHAGNLPLPPYISRKADATDTNRYQTVYAKDEGSVAAPTAGLHFTEAILNQLQLNHVTIDYVTLHVGAGTFKPVKATNMQQHEMHSEFIEVNTSTMALLLNKKNAPVIAVGTTSFRTLESLYWMGVKLLANPATIFTSKTIAVQQWDAYTLPQHFSTYEALTTLKKWMRVNGFEKIITKTQLLVVPGYQPRVIEAIVTNFHQPGSTLLLLIAAFIGDDWKKVYQHALENNYRFLSYGDGSLLWAQPSK